MAQTTSNSIPVSFSQEPVFFEPIKIEEFEFSYKILLRMREVLEQMEFSLEKIWVLPNNLPLKSMKYNRAHDVINSRPPTLKKIPRERTFLLHQTSSGELLSSDTITGKCSWVDINPLLTKNTEDFVKLIKNCIGFKDLEQQGFTADDIMSILMNEEQTEIDQEIIECLKLNVEEHKTLDYLIGYIGSYHTHNNISLPMPNHKDLEYAMNDPKVKLEAVGGYRMETPIVTVAIRKKNINIDDWFIVAEELYLWLHRNMKHKFRYVLSIDEEYCQITNHIPRGYRELYIPHQNKDYLQSLELIVKLIFSRYFTIASINLDEFALIPNIPSVIPSDVYPILKSIMTAFLWYIPKNKQRKVKHILKTCQPKKVRRLIAFFRDTFLSLLEIGMKGIC